MAVVVFLSAVSKEFHDSDPRQPQAFESYRYILERSLSRLGTGYQVIVQETLAQGFGDLLGMLDEEVGKSDVVVHLVGEMAGAIPQAVSLRRLREHHRDFLSHEPELAESIGEGHGISYTQWEFYLAVQHRQRRLAFLADPTAPRSPLKQSDDQQRASQAEHVRRLKLMGEHPEPFADQRDLALKVVTSVVRRGLGPASDVSPPTPEIVQAARDQAPQMVREIAEGLKQASKTALQPNDPAGVEAYLRPVDSAALKYELDRRTTLELVQEHVEETRLDSQTDPTAENLYELAFAELAMGNYPAAITAARQSAELARARMIADPDHTQTHREQALNALLLLSEAAQLAHRHAESIAALEQGGTLIDPTREPVFWADYHEPLAEDYLTYAQYARAKSLIDQILDIRDDHQGEGHPAYPNSLLVWCNLLYAEADYRGEIGVAARAERLFTAQIPPNLPGIAAALNCQGVTLHTLGRHRESEPLLRRSLALDEQSYGAEHPEVARALNNLAGLLQDTNRLAEAEPLMRRALAID
ncbi:MAG: tetratricopeptide repeat protein, partial [Planctomycetota bacterium]